VSTTSTVLLARARPWTRGAIPAFLATGALALASCNDGDITPPDGGTNPEVVVVPVVVHVVHQGEPLGVGTNISDERIHAQIRILNEDYRRKPGTPGYNTHPDGGDARIEFVLASVGPDGRFEPGEPTQAEGILINAAHFGPSDLSSEHGQGRTLTHEMGHYFGLLHTWGTGECETNDYCADTPAVTQPVLGCPSSPPPGCDGEPVMVENYMNYTFDACMNTFTNDQIERIHYVLENSPRRRELPESPGLSPM
jgi:hypothetical protein